MISIVQLASKFINIFDYEFGCWRCYPVPVSVPMLVARKETLCLCMLIKMMVKWQFNILEKSFHEVNMVCFLLLFLGFIFLWTVHVQLNLGTSASNTDLNVWTLHIAQNKQKINLASEPEPKPKPEPAFCLYYFIYRYALSLFIFLRIHSINKRQAHLCASFGVPMVFGLKCILCHINSEKTFSKIISNAFVYCNSERFLLWFLV